MIRLAVLGRPHAPNPQHRDYLDSLNSVAALQEYYDESAHKWFTADVKAAFTAKRAALAGS